MVETAGNPIMNEIVFKAMADPTRRKIIELLKEEPKTASEIAALIVLRMRNQQSVVI
ncbi:helix-turn-helix domain-containing protein [Alicyclobacillus fastidiosus]